MLPVGEGSTGSERLAEIGIETRNEESKILIDNVVFSSPTNTSPTCVLVQFSRSIPDSTLASM